jgi:hypothetical protein
MHLSIYLPTYLPTYLPSKHQNAFTYLPTTYLGRYLVGVNEVKLDGLHDKLPKVEP